jgi:prepilin-type N-terminal cleavage/methylation domain-containing protein
MSRKTGFTLIELLMVMGMMVSLIALASTSLLGSRSRTGLNSARDVFISHVRLQQTKAMLGDTEGRSAPDSYGIYLDNQQYVLFHGLAYSAGDPANSVIKLDSGLRISGSFPGQNLVFLPVSGEVAGFTSGSDTITIASTVTSAFKTIQFNRYGLIISEN